MLRGMAYRCDVLVIGAGPVGLASARAAAEQGADVILIDRSEPGPGSAAHAAAGLLAPGRRELWTGPLGVLCRRAMADSGAYAQELSELTDLRVGSRSPGLQEVAQTTEEEQALKDLMEALEAEEAEAGVEWVELADTELGLRAAPAALSFELPGTVGARTLVPTMLSACQLVRVRTRFGVEVTGGEWTRDGVLEGVSLS